MQFEIPARFEFKFIYINEDESTCEVSGELPFGVYPTEKAINKLQEQCNQRVEDQTNGEYRPVTPQELARIKMEELTGQRFSVAVSNEWVAPYSSLEEDED